MSLRGSVASLSIAIAMAGGSAAAKAFDLQCGDAHYRIDLKERWWCEDACEEPRGLHYNGGRTVYLSSMEHFGIVYDMRTKLMMFETGGVGSPGEASRTRCQVMRFSGFPFDPKSLAR